MEQTIGDWCAWLSLRHSSATVDGYRWELMKLSRAHAGKCASEFRARDLTHYLAERRFGGCGDASIKRSVAAFRNFFAWVCGKSRSPARGLEFPRVRLRKQRVLTAAQLSALVGSCDTSTLRGVRDVALVALAVDARLRAGELCRLRVVDVDLESRRLRVVVKGGLQQERAYSETTMRLLSAWLSVRASTAGEVFVSVGGLTRGRALTTSGLRAIFRGLGKRAGLGAFSPHDLCRTFAVLATRRGAPSRVVQVAGGWANIALVEVYTRGIELEEIERYLPMG